jgi:hypothetical protein
MGQKLLPKNPPKDTDPAQFRILDFVQKATITVPWHRGINGVRFCSGLEIPSVALVLFQYYDMEN